MSVIIFGLFFTLFAKPCFSNPAEPLFNEATADGVSIASRVYDTSNSKNITEPKGLLKENLRLNQGKESFVEDGRKNSKNRHTPENSVKTKGSLRTKQVKNRRKKRIKNENSNQNHKDENTVDKNKGKAEKDEDEDDESKTGGEDDESETGDEDDESETGDEDDESETGDEDDESETGDEDDESETGDEKMEKKENVADDEDVDENLKRDAPNKEERDQDDDEDNFIDIRNERKLFSKQNVNSRMPPIKSKKKVAKRRKAPSNKKRAGSVVKRKRKHKNQPKDHQRAKLSSSRQHKRVKMRNHKIAKNRKNKKSRPEKKKKVDKKYRSEIESDEDEFMDAEEKASMVVTLISDPNEIDPSTLEDAEQHDNIYANFALFMLLVIFVVLIVVFRTCRKTNSVTQRAAMIAFIPQSPGIKKSLSESNKQAPMDQPPPYSPSKPPAQQYY